VVGCRRIMGVRVIWEEEEEEEEVGVGMGIRMISLMMAVVGGVRGGLGGDLRELGLREGCVGQVASGKRRVCYTRWLDMHRDSIGMER